MKLRTTALTRLYDNMTFEINVLNSYIHRVEEDICQGIESYKNKITLVHEEEHEEDNQSYYHEVTECEGLDSDTYSFESVFEEYFPQLQRISSLIILCSFFEHSLIRLCYDLQKENAIEKKVDDTIRKGVIESSIKYLTKIVGIELNLGTQNYSEIKNIKSIRNSFVHHDGLILTGKVRSYVDNHNNFLSGITKININSGFLQHVINCYKTFFQLIYDSLNNNYINSKKLGASFKNPIL